MKVTTWNLNGIRALAKNNPKAFQQTESDVICLQEIRASQEQTEKVCTELGVSEIYPHRIQSVGERAGYCGTAIWSKHPLEKIHSQTPTNESGIQEGRLCAANIQGYQILSIYTPNTGHKPSRALYRFNTWDPFIQELSEKLSNPILAGDFNVAPCDRDLAEPEKHRNSPGASVKERARFKSLSKELHDNFRLHHPKSIEYTWWDYRGQMRKHNLGWRIDHILSKKEALSCKILGTVTGSDHCPCSAVF